MGNATSGNTVLGTVLSATKRYTSLKITNIALDGTPYVQNTGSAIIRYEVYLYCPTSEKRDAVDEASNKGAIIDVEWNGKTIRGYVEQDVTWREWKDGHGVGAFTMIVKEVVA